MKKQQEQWDNYITGVQYKLIRQGGHLIHMFITACVNHKHQHQHTDHITDDQMSRPDSRLALANERHRYKVMWFLIGWAQT